MMKLEWILVPLVLIIIYYVVTRFTGKGHGNWRVRLTRQEIVVLTVLGLVIFIASNISWPVGPVLALLLAICLIYLYQTRFKRRNSC